MPEFRAGPDNHFSTVLKTATALADPVLIRLSNTSSHTLLLAEVVTYDRAGEIHLNRVRFLPPRRGLRSMLPATAKSRGYINNLTLQSSRDYIAFRIPSHPCTRVASVSPHFSMKQLTLEQSILLRSSSPRRFAAMAFQLTPVPSLRRLHVRPASSHYSVKRRVQAVTHYAALTGAVKRLALAFARA